MVAPWRVHRPGHMAGSGAPCPEPSGLKVHRPVSSAGVQLPAAGLTLATALNSQTRREPTMQTLLHHCDDGPPALPAQTCVATNLSLSRMLGGNSENAAAIPAINPPAIRRSDSDAAIVNPATLAPPALRTRRGFMNTLVSTASLATAAVVATPLIADAATFETTDDRALLETASEILRLQTGPTRRRPDKTAVECLVQREGQASCANELYG
jgi:hypothetical protein